MSWLPHRVCYLDDPTLVWGMAITDLCFFIAYTGITVWLVRMAMSREANGTKAIQLIFAAFISLCGLTHLFGAVTLWWPIFYPELITNTLGAAVSLGALSVFAPFARDVLKLKADMGEVDELRREIERLRSCLR